MKGILGRKILMTTLFTKEGEAMPITVIQVPKNIVLQVKNIARDGYDSLKLAAFEKKINKSIKPEIGEFKKVNKNHTTYFIKEVNEMKGYKEGDLIDASIFTVGDYVDVTGTSKGKGFQGAIKRHNFSIGPKSHGSKYHRKPGSSGDIRSVVKKNKKMPGRMGAEQSTIQNLVVVSIDLKNNLILLKGAIPGPNKGFVVIRDSIKKGSKKNILELANFFEAKLRNELLEDAKKVKAKISLDMSIDQIKDEIKSSAIILEKEKSEKEALLSEANDLRISNYNKLSLTKLRELVSKSRTITKNKSDGVSERTKKDEKDTSK